MSRRLYYKSIQLPQLRSFCAAATKGSFTKAAAELGISAATIWEQVRALEQKLQVTLLCRRGRELELTAEGRLVLELVQPHVNGLDSLERLFEARRVELPAQLTLAATPYLIIHHLPPCVHAFSQAHPSVLVRLQTCLTGKEVFRMVEERRADLGVAPYDSNELRSSSLEYEHLYDLNFMLLTAPHHPLARKREVRVSDLVRYPLVLNEKGSPDHRVLERLLRQHNLADRVHAVVENISIDAARNYIALGVGIALRYVHRDIHRLIPGLHARLFDPKIEDMAAVVVTRKGAHLPDHVQEFGRTLRHLPTA